MQLFGFSLAVDAQLDGHGVGTVQIAVPGVGKPYPEVSLHACSM